MIEKVCTLCYTPKPLTEYYVTARGKYGRYSRCKTCVAVVQKSKPEQRKQTVKRYRDRHPERALLSQCKARAKKAGIPFSLEEKDITIPTHCPVLGFELKRNPKSFIDTSPSIDRIDSSKGYVQDNILIVSWRANALKKNATIEELEKLATFYRNLTKV